LVDSEIYLEKLNEELSEMKKKEKGGGGKTKLLKKKTKLLKRKYRLNIIFIILYLI
jgi:hypothetical protein